MNRHEVLATFISTGGITTTPKKTCRRVCALATGTVSPTRNNRINNTAATREVRRSLPSTPPIGGDTLGAEGERVVIVGSPFHASRTGRDVAREERRTRPRRVGVVFVGLILDSAESGMATIAVDRVGPTPARGVTHDERHVLGPRRATLSP